MTPLLQANTGVYPCEAAFVRPPHDNQSIRVNDRFRVCFEWANGAAYNVEIVDYH